MPTLSCLCGENIDLSSIPNDKEFELLPDILRERIVDKLGNAYDSLNSKKEFERTAYRVLGHLETPGIMHLVECPVCHRLAIFARSSDTVPLFWFQREKTNYPTRATSLKSLVEQLEVGELPPGWQT